MVPHSIPSSPTLQVRSDVSCCKAAWESALIFTYTRVIRAQAKSGWLALPKLSSWVDESGNCSRQGTPNRLGCSLLILGVANLMPKGDVKKISKEEESQQRPRKKKKRKFSRPNSRSIYVFNEFCFEAAAVCLFIYLQNCMECAIYWGIFHINPRTRFFPQT